jgi:integrase
MPKLPTNMITRPDREGYWYRCKRHGKVRVVALGTDYREAVKRLRSLKTEGSATSNATLAAAAEEWHRSYCATRRTERGQLLAEQRMRDFVLPQLGHVQLCRVTKEDVRALRLSLERKCGLSSATVSAILSDLRCLLLWCVDAGFMERSPFPRRVMPKLQEQPPDRLTDEDAQQLRRLPEPYGFVCRLALATGLRWGELTRAQGADVKRFRAPGSEMEQAFIEVSQTKSKRVRRVPVPPELLRELRNKVGRLVPFAERSPGSFAKAVRRSTGLPGFHVHQMRHTFACQWLVRGGTLAALQQLLGHASIVTTQRYAKLSDEAVMREAQRLQTPVSTASVTRVSPGDEAAERQA